MGFFLLPPAEVSCVLELGGTAEGGVWGQGEGDLEGWGGCWVG